MGRQVGQHEQPDSGGGRQYDALGSQFFERKTGRFLRFRPKFRYPEYGAKPSIRVHRTQAKLNGASYVLGGDLATTGPDGFFELSHASESVRIVSETPVTPGPSTRSELCPMVSLCGSMEKSSGQIPIFRGRFLSIKWDKPSWGSCRGSGFRSTRQLGQPQENRRLPRSQMGAEKSLGPTSSLPYRSTRFRRPQTISFPHWLTRPWVMRASRFSPLLLPGCRSVTFFQSFGRRGCRKLRHGFGAGSTTITAMQMGDDRYHPASPVSRILHVVPPGVKDDQFITFQPIPEKVRDDPAFSWWLCRIQGINHPVFTLPVTFTVDYGPASVDAAGVLVLDGMEGTSVLPPHKAERLRKGGSSGYSDYRGYFETKAGNSFSGSRYRWFAFDPSGHRPLVLQGVSVTSGLPVQITSSDPDIVQVFRGSRIIPRKSGTVTLTFDSPGNAFLFQPKRRREVSP